MEVHPRRRPPPAVGSALPLVRARRRRPVDLLRRRHARPRPPRRHLAHGARQAPHRRPPPPLPFRRAGRLRRRPPLPPDRRLAPVCADRRALVCASRLRLCRLHRPRSRAVGARRNLRRPAHHAPRAAAALAWAARASPRDWCLPRLPAAARRGPVLHQPDPAPDPHAATVGASPCRRPVWRAPPVRLGRHRALLALLVSVERAHLLALRFPVPHGDDDGAHLRRGWRRALLLSALPRGLPLVVALLRAYRLLRPLLLLARRCIRPQRASYLRAHRHRNLLRLHRRRLSRAVPRDGRGQLRRLLLVCPLHLCCSQGRLKP
mmetsp:Transcript_41284/g.136810  ORF Transcript_41284/g.136810 Transcript_41284/m.136810 type:complete len:320 (-) Transcript_41284:147-1106(-)